MRITPFPLNIIGDLVPVHYLAMTSTPVSALSILDDYRRREYNRKILANVVPLSGAFVAPGTPDYCPGHCVSRPKRFYPRQADRSTRVCLHHYRIPDDLATVALCHLEGIGPVLE